MSWISSPSPFCSQPSVADTSTGGVVGEVLEHPGVPAGAGASLGDGCPNCALLQHRRSDDGAAAAAPPGVVQRIHLVLEPIDVVEVRLP